MLPEIKIIVDVDSPLICQWVACVASVSARVGRRAQKKKMEYLVSPSIFLGLIVFRNWNFSGLAYKRFFEYNVSACLLLVFSRCLTIS